MQKIFFSLVLLLSVVGLIAENFEFLGIRSGMTKDEVKMVIEFDNFDEGSTSNPKSSFDEDGKLYLWDKLYLDKNYSNNFTTYPALAISFSFTEDDILWEMVVSFKASSSLDGNYLINISAQNLALEASFPNAEVEKRNGSREFAVILIDNDILNEAINKKKGEFINKYKYTLND